MKEANCVSMEFHEAPNYLINHPWAQAYTKEYDCCSLMSMSSSRELPLHVPSDDDRAFHCKVLLLSRALALQRSVCSMTQTNARIEMFCKATFSIYECVTPMEISPYSVTYGLGA